MLPNVPTVAESLPGVRFGNVSAFSFADDAGTDQVVMVVESRETNPAKARALLQALAMAEAPPEIDPALLRALCKAGRCLARLAATATHLMGLTPTGSAFTEQ